MAFHNKAANFNGSAQSHTSLTQESSSDCIGAGRINQGIAGGPFSIGGKWSFWAFRGGRIGVAFCIAVNELVYQNYLRLSNN